MDMTWEAGLWRQLGAAIDMLDNAVRACSDELWQEPIHSGSEAPPKYAEYWYVAYHCLFWLDLDLSETAEGFAPPAPFSLSELDAEGFPDRVYTRDELLTYLQHCREKGRARLEALSDALLPQRTRPNRPDWSVAEMMLYTMRHVQEHAAQLSLFLGQRVGSAPGWVSKPKS
jgi:hypothetical protein